MTTALLDGLTHRQPVIVKAGASKDGKEKRQALIHPEIGVALLERKMGVDLTGSDVDGPLPPVPPSAVLSSRVDQTIGTAKRDGLSIRGLYQRFAAPRGHFAIVGSPLQIADHMQQWFEEGAADGFNFMAPIFPGGLRDFVDLVVAELQRRGLYRTSYEGRTLRENLSVPTPVSRYVRQPEKSGA